MTGSESGENEKTNLFGNVRKSGLSENKKKVLARSNKPKPNLFLIRYAYMQSEAVNKVCKKKDPPKRVNRLLPPDYQAGQQNMTVTDSLEKFNLTSVDHSSS